MFNNTNRYSCAVEQQVHLLLETWHLYLFWCVNTREHNEIRVNMTEVTESMSGMKRKRKGLFTISSKTLQRTGHNCCIFFGWGVTSLSLPKIFLHQDSEVNGQHIISEFIWAILWGYSTWTMNHDLTWVA